MGGYGMRRKDGYTYNVKTKLNFKKNKRKWYFDLGHFKNRNSYIK